MSEQRKYYIVLISMHGLIRGQNLELGRDADTGGQTLYVIELARALAKHPNIQQVDLLTRRVNSPEVDSDYKEPIEALCEGARIVRIDTGPDEYIPKEQLWEHLDIFVDNAIAYYRDAGITPDLIHSHYADAGYVGSHMANQLGAPLIHTGHSLGRVKRRRLLASGVSDEDIETQYNISRRIEAEELTLGNSERVITSTFQEIEEQYELYDHYQPEQMRVIPPGTDLAYFTPPQDGDLTSPWLKDLSRFLNTPDKPIILAISRADKRKNIISLIEAYGQDSELQELANLVIIAGNRNDIDELDKGTHDVFKELLIAIDRYDLYGKVAMPKHHQRDQVSSFYRVAAALKGVFVNPALTEPFGLTLIEAAACGLPIVATQDGGPRDIIENCHNGFLINPLDNHDISEKIKSLLQDSALWSQCSAAGLSGVREHYSWDAHANRYFIVIDPIIKRTELLQRRAPQRRPTLYRRKALFSDLDQNLLGDQASLDRLIKQLRSHRKSIKFGIATGRRLDSALKVMKKHGIPEPDILITSGGAEIHYAPDLTSDIYWRRHIDFQWIPVTVRDVLDELPGLKRQPKSEQSLFKVSYYIDTQKAPNIEEINGLLHQRGLNVNINLAFGQFLDISPIRASKGLALRYVADRWQIPLQQILVAGGSGADEDMMRGNTLAAVIANRHNEELSNLKDIDNIYFAENSYAAGILEAIDHYHFFDNNISEQKA